MIVKGSPLFKTSDAPANSGSRWYLYRIAYVDLVDACRDAITAYDFGSVLSNVPLRAITHCDIGARLCELDRHSFADTAASPENHGGAIWEICRHCVFSNPDGMRLAIQEIAQEDRAANLHQYDRNAVLMLVRPLDMMDVAGRGNAHSGAPA